MHKRVIPDLLEGGGKISYLPRYIATRLVESISTIQNLFHFAIYCSMQGFGYFQKRGLQHLLAAIDSKEGIQERLESLPHAIQCQIYHRIYLNSDRSGKGPNWGKEHALDDLNRLQKAVKQTQAMPYTLYWESNLEQKSYRYTLFGSKPDHGGSGFVNGMGLDPNHAQNFDALSICNAYNPGQEMQGVYLATSGKNLWGAINDYLEAILGLSYQPTGVILEIHAMWDDFFDRNSEGEFRHFCASKGAIMTRVALETYPHKDRLKKIRVIAVTPAALIGITEARVMHFVSPFDIFPYLVAGLRESLLGGNPNVTIVNAPGQERERSAHDPHSIAYQTAIKTYLEQG